MPTPASRITVRRSEAADIPQIIELCRRVYVGSPAWSETQLRSHQAVFPDGQLVAVAPDGSLVGTAASLIIRWDDYDWRESWRDFTDTGLFTNHDAHGGHTLYGAEVMVDPTRQGQGIGRLLYDARRELCERLDLWRIRAGARLRGYHAHAATMSAEEYVARVVRGELFDATLSFQLRRGFEVLAVVPEYLRHDPESLGWAGLIEWLNPAHAAEVPPFERDPRFVRPRPSSQA